MALAPPAEKDGFFYAGDALYREASNLNRHRRATLPELKAHFNGKDASGDNSRPAHWYEAQLLHYGLPPSKVKGTAHKRLWDAVMKPGGLVVPAHIQKIEADLKKEWTKREREAKKMLKDASTAKPAPAKGTKRKADQVSTATSVNVSVSGHGSSMVNVVVQTAQSVSKKAKTATPVTKAKKTTAPAKSTAGTVSSKKATAPQTARKIATPKEKKATTTKAPTAAKAAARSPVKPKATPKQTARASFASGSGSAPGFGMSGSSFHTDEAPPPYSEFDSRPVGPSSNGKQKPQSSPPSSSQARIGLLNGRYRVSCPAVELDFPQHAGDLGLIATLDGTNLWLKFDFGIVDGMIKLSRPGEYGNEGAIGAYWRGNAQDRSGRRRLWNIDTVHRVGPLNHVSFLGGGHLRGKLYCGDVELDFDAYRLSGQSMTSEVTPSQARAEWARLDEYADS